MTTVWNTLKMNQLCTFISQIDTGGHVVRLKTVMEDVHDTQMSENVTLNGLLPQENNRIIEEADIAVHKVSGEDDVLNNRWG